MPAQRRERTQSASVRLSSYAVSSSKRDESEESEKQERRASFVRTRRSSARTAVLAAVDHLLRRRDARDERKRTIVDAPLCVVEAHGERPNTFALERSGDHEIVGRLA